jgi:hypothetical protein
MCALEPTQLTGPERCAYRPPADAVEDETDPLLRHVHRPMDTQDMEDMGFGPTAHTQFSALKSFLQGPAYRSKGLTMDPHVHPSRNPPLVTLAPPPPPQSRRKSAVGFPPTASSSQVVLASAPTPKRVPPPSPRGSSSSSSAQRSLPPPRLEDIGYVEVDPLVSGMSTMSLENDRSDTLTPVGLDYPTTLTQPILMHQLSREWEESPANSDSLVFSARSNPRDDFVLGLPPSSSHHSLFSIGSGRRVSEPPKRCKERPLETPLPYIPSNVGSVLSADDKAAASVHLSDYPDSLSDHLAMARGAHGVVDASSAAFKSSPTSTPNALATGVMRVPVGHTTQLVLSGQSAGWAADTLVYMPTSDNERARLFGAMQSLASPQ